MLSKFESTTLLSQQQKEKYNTNYESQRISMVPFLYVSLSWQPRLSCNFCFIGTQRFFIFHTKIKNKKNPLIQRWQIDFTCLVQQLSPTTFFKPNWKWKLPKFIIYVICWENINKWKRKVLFLSGNRENIYL